ncbi:hypothetical protein [Streptomyces sp. G45]|uniref:hypothetical protein n=1 Tax=Streptomyces sp. G45 TaxID=3406627 RepID=UPI003C155BF6
MVTTNPPTLRRASVKATPPMRDRLEEEFTKLRAKGRTYEEADGGYTKAAVDVTVDDSSRKGDTATLRVTEDGRLHMPFTAGEVAAGAPEYEEYSLSHTIEFTRQPDGGWLLSSDQADAGSGPTPSTQLAQPDTVDE